MTLERYPTNDASNNSRASAIGIDNLSIPKCVDSVKGLWMKNESGVKIDEHAKSYRKVGQPSTGKRKIFSAVGQVVFVAPRCRIHVAMTYLLPSQYLKWSTSTNGIRLQTLKDDSWGALPPLK